MQHLTSDSPSWFQNWFGSPYYKLLYQHRDTEEARVFIGNITRHLGLRKGDQVLDLACGRGRHSVELHRLGFDVVGMDISQESIAEARSAESAGLRFTIHDMREPFPVKGLDAVLNLFTSFGYFHSRYDDLMTIMAVKQSLKTGGVLVIDFMNSERTIREMVAEEVVEREGVRFHIRRNMTKGIITKTITVSDKGNQCQFREEVDALTLTDFKSYFKEAGLVLTKTLGDYGLTPFEADRSDRLIMIARKETA